MKSTRFGYEFRKILSILIIAGIVVHTIGCASNAAKQAIPLSESLNSAQCGSGEFRGAGIGDSEEAALNIARSALARQIYSSVTVSEKYLQSQKVLAGNENLSSEYKSEVIVESALSNAHEARTHRAERRSMRRA